MKIWGPPEWSKILSPMYFIKCVSEFGLWSKSKYNIARSNRPDIIPPMREVILCWGRFANMIECAKRRDVRKSIDEYAKYILAHGNKIPSSDELNKAGLRIGSAVEIFGCKKKFDDFVLNYMAGHIIEVADEN